MTWSTASCRPSLRMNTAAVFTLLLATATASSAAAPCSPWLYDWPEREAQLRKWKSKAAISDKRLRAIALLTKESRKLHACSDGSDLGEAYGDYYVNLALFVKNLRDPRSIEALAGAMDIAGSISTTLADFGDAAVRDVIARVSDPDLGSDAVFTLGKFLQGEQLGRFRLTDSHRSEIRSVLLKATASRKPVVRLEAAEALRFVRGDDNDVVAALERLANNDAFVRPGAKQRNPSTLSPTDYPVRKAARESLALLAQKARH